MAAADEFPRGRWLTDTVTAGQASVTFPAIAGVSWVLTQIDAILYASNSNAAAYQILTAPGASALTGIVAVDATNAPPQTPLLQMAEWTWSGSIVFPVDSTCEVLFNTVASPGSIQTLNVYAYLI